MRPGEDDPLSQRAKGGREHAWRRGLIPGQAQTAAMIPGDRHELARGGFEHPAAVAEPCHGSRVTHRPYRHLSARAIRCCEQVCRQREQDPSSQRSSLLLLKTFLQLSRVGVDDVGLKVRGGTRRGRGTQAIGNRMPGGKGHDPAWYVLERTKRNRAIGRGEGGQIREARVEGSHSRQEEARVGVLGSDPEGFSFRSPGPCRQGAKPDPKTTMAPTTGGNAR